ncbi:MAG: ABC transporter permease subunit [Planctomycetes bacterium]|nr:ABC transporter permease subunit [Planctomycetota bacterium]
MHEASTQRLAELPGATESNSRALTIRQYRRFAYQIGFVLVVGALGWAAWENVQANIAVRNLNLGFAFLNQEAGFGIPFSVLPYSETDSYGWVFVVGVANTMLVAFLGIIAATVLGFAIGIARLSPNWAVANAALVYIEAVRNLPLLLHVLIWYNVVIRSLPPARQAISVGNVAFLSNRGIFLPWLTTGLGAWTLCAIGLLTVAGLGFILHRSRLRREASGEGLPTIRLCAIWIGAVVVGVLVVAHATIHFEIPELRGFNFGGGIALSPELAALVIALATYNASFIAELIRGAIEAVDRGQREAALSLGLDRMKTLRLVVIPQAVRLLVPPLTNQYLHLLKASSLATVIGYPDIVNIFVGTTLNQTGRAIEIMGLTMAVFLALSLGITGLSNLYNRHMRIVGR